MKIGIVGGSLAGCSAASLLKNAGHEITVFERSASDLTGRGGGIGTSKEIIEQITKEGLINDDFTCLTAKKMPFIGKHEAYEPFGRTAWSLPVEIKVFHWNELWQQLRQNVPDACYRVGVEIVDAYQLENGKVEIVTKHGEIYMFDLLLFADGYKSLGRKILFPDKQLKYTGYVLWRGLLDESEMRAGELEDNMPRMSYLDGAGHNVVYFIPNKDGSKEKGKRIFNWAAYIAISERELNDLMTDKSGRIRNGTLPPGEITKDNELKLKKFLSKNIPEYYGELVNKTLDSYIQVIYTLDLDAYYKDNMCLIGDAGMVVQPFTGSGVFKGFSNIKDLISSMDRYNKLEDALKEWSLQQVKTGKKLLAFGEQLEKAFVWEPMDFSSGEEKDIARWFKEAVTAPEEFNFERKT